MSSFIDLMADHDWSDADILNRCEAMKRSQFSDQEEQILNRKEHGVERGLYVMSPDESAEQQAFEYLAFQLQQLRVQATADRDLLRAARAVEAAQADLASLPPAPSDGSPDPVADQRAADQAVIAAASQPTLDLVAQRAAYIASLTPAPPGP